RVPCCYATRCGQRSCRPDERRARSGDGDRRGGVGVGDGDGDGDGGQGGPDHVSEREFSERPWGNYTVLDDAEPDHKVKRLVVHPGKRLSYQRHSKRAEHWFIVAGTATVTLDGTARRLAPGQSIDIPREGAHRIANDGD